MLDHDEARRLRRCPARRRAGSPSSRGGSPAHRARARAASGSASRARAPLPPGRWACRRSPAGSRGRAGPCRPRRSRRHAPARDSPPRPRPWPPGPASTRSSRHGLGLLAALQVVDAVQARAGDLRHGAAEIVVVELLRVGPVDARARRSRCRSSTAPRRRPPTPCATSCGRSLLRAPRPASSTRVAPMPGRSASSSVSAGLPGKSPRPSSLLQPPAAGLIDGARLLARLPVLEHADDQAVHLECGYRPCSRSRIASLSPFRPMPAVPECRHGAGVFFGSRPRAIEARNRLLYLSYLV